MDEKTNQEIKKKEKRDKLYPSAGFQNKLLFVNQRHYEAGGKSAKPLAYRQKKRRNGALIAEITAEEINTAISKLKANKSPGTDGYTAECYKSLRESLTPLLQKTFNWVLKEGEIPYS